MRAHPEVWYTYTTLGGASRARWMRRASTSAWTPKRERELTPTTVPLGQVADITTTVGPPRQGVGTRKARALEWTLFPEDRLALTSQKNRCPATCAASTAQV